MPATSSEGPTKVVSQVMNDATAPPVADPAEAEWQAPWETLGPASADPYEMQPVGAGPVTSLQVPPEEVVVPVPEVALGKHAELPPDADARTDGGTVEAEGILAVPPPDQTQPSEQPGGGQFVAEPQDRHGTSVARLLTKNRRPWPCRSPSGRPC